MVQHKVIAGEHLINELIRVGVVPPNTSRIVIDVDLNECTRVWFETYGDERLLEVKWNVGVSVSRGVPE